jgi:hypothetical protein
MRLPADRFTPILRAESGATKKNLKNMAGRDGRLAHRFTPIDEGTELKLGALSAYIRLAEAAQRGGQEVVAPVPEVEVEGVCIDAIRAHIAALAAGGVAVALPEGALGPEDLALSAIKLRRGEMVIWDSTVPHHNVAAAAGNTCARMSACVPPHPFHRDPRPWSTSGGSARVGNRQNGRLSALRAHTKAPYKMNFHRKTLRNAKGA